LVSKLKKLPTEWEKIFAIYISSQGTDNESIWGAQKPELPNNHDPLKKWANGLNRAFSKEEVQMAKKHMKNCSPSLAIKEMQIKTTLRFHLTPVRITTIKNAHNNKKRMSIEILN
jgi:hypothetical protein